MKTMRGFAILSAIFILVVLAALGAFILNVSSNQQIGSALDVQGARAYQAARAGIEWGLYRVQESYGFGAGGADPNTRVCDNANDNFDIFGFRVVVSCTRSNQVISGEPRVYIITATACSDTTCPNTTNPGNLYIERRLTVTF